MDRRFEIAFSTPSPVPMHELHKIIGDYLAGYSLQIAQGAWEETVEHSYLVNTVLSPNAYPRAKYLAARLKREYEQQCVLVTSWDVNVEFI